MPAKPGATCEQVQPVSPRLCCGATHQSSPVVASLGVTMRSPSLLSNPPGARSWVVCPVSVAVPRPHDAPPPTARAAAMRRWILNRLRISSLPMSSPCRSARSLMKAPGCLGPAARAEPGRTSRALLLHFSPPASARSGQPLRLGLPPSGSEAPGILHSRTFDAVLTRVPGRNRGRGRSREAPRIRRPSVEHVPSP